jgi:NAD(P)H-hydrate epimerase
VIRILSAAQLREADRITIEKEPVSSIDLMERAATGFTEVFTSQFDSSKPVFIFCGYGNNGGDGLAIGRLLLGKKYEVTVFILADRKEYSEDFRVNESRLLEINPQVVSYLQQQQQFPFILPGTIVIDALFGSGLKKSLEGLSLQLVDYLNKQDATRISVDIPSGLFADEPASGTIFKSHETITFQLPKLSFLFAGNSEVVGDWKVVDIDLDKDFLEEAPTTFFMLEKEDIRKILHPRKKFDHKGTFGHVFIYTGQKGKMGAAILCTQACVKSGAGLTTTYIPKGESLALNVTIPEAMTKEYAGAKKVVNARDISSYTAFAFGPGIGTAITSRRIFHDLLSKIKIPIVIDADALNILAMEKNFQKLIPKKSILTPHPKEFERLAGKTKSWYDRLQAQLKLSKKWSVYIVLKGAHTCISTPEGMCYFNSTGNPGMAKGGSGDILTGMIVAFLAQKIYST